MKNKWFASGVTQNESGEMRNTLFALSAANRDEATGKALRLFRKWYPANGGWVGHSAVVLPADTPISEDCR